MQGSPKPPGLMQPTSTLIFITNLETFQLVRSGTVDTDVSFIFLLFYVY